MKSLFALIATALLTCTCFADATPLKAGKLLCDLNVKEKSSDWENFQNYGNRLTHGYEVMDNVSVMTFRNAEQKRHDTAWSIQSKEIPLDAAIKNIIVEIDFQANLIWNVPNMPKTPFRNCVVWYNSSKKKIKHTDITYLGYPNKFTLSKIQLEVPAGAVVCRVQFGTDHPNITDQQFIAYRSVKIFAAQ